MCRYSLFFKNGGPLLVGSCFILLIVLFSQRCAPRAAKKDKAAYLTLLRERHSILKVLTPLIALLSKRQGPAGA